MHARKEMSENVDDINIYDLPYAKKGLTIFSSYFSLFFFRIKILSFSLLINGM